MTSFCYLIKGRRNFLRLRLIKLYVHESSEATYILSGYFFPCKRTKKKKVLIIKAANQLSISHIELKTLIYKYNIKIICILRFQPAFARFGRQTASTRWTNLPAMTGLGGNPMSCLANDEFVKGYSIHPIFEFGS